MTPGENESGTSVSYSVKELLRDIKSSVDVLHGKVDSKADRADVAELAREINVERQRINNIETSRTAEARTSNAVTEWKRWAVPAILTLILAAMAVLTYFQGKH